MAFCGSCGKEIGDSVKFCPYCGKDTGLDVSRVDGPVQVVPGVKPKTDIFQIISWVITVFAMLGMFLPIAGIDYWIKKDINLISAWDYATSFFGDKGFFVYVMLFVATVFAVLCIGLAIRAFIVIFKKTRGVDTDKAIRLSAWCEAISMVTVLVLTWIINIDFGTNMLGLTFVGWIMLIVTLLNIFVFTNKNVKGMLKS